MKKVYILLGLAIALLLPAISDAACDQDFYKTLRLGYQYKFGDNFSANGADRWIRTKKIGYSEQYDYNDSSSFPTFSWTSSIKNADWKVAKNTSMEIVTADDRYQVKKRPVSRSYDNLLVKYTIKYSNDVAGSTKYEHTECAHYEISRCGDGVVDSKYGEQCDPKDTSHAGWGDMGCSNECKPINVPSGCDETFYSKLRYGHKYTFYDDFHANAGDKWLWTFNVYHNEKFDYNKSPNFPSFGWTADIKSSNYKVNSNTTKRVVEATSQYSILAVPPTRAYDNLFIKYTLGYSSDVAGENRYAHSECAYYEITRCGDGVLDADYETCDPKDPNKTGWGDGGCDNSCKPIVNPSTKGKLEIEKTLIGTDKIEKVGDIITWKIKVTAKEGDVTNFIVTDKLPEVLAYDSYTVTHNPGLTVNEPTVSADTVQWIVKGTLKEGKYLEIELKTKATKMPKKNYKNVACVAPEDNPKDEECDDEPLPTDGALEIEKTLIGSKEIKEVGDTVTWNIKVTAVGGDVKNPVITDKLPSILGYSDSLILHNPGITIPTKPDENGNILTRKTTGVLKKGEYIEIQLTTYAKKMPDKEYENVACVHPEDNPNDEKCDDEEVPAPKLWIKKYILDGDKEIKKKVVKIGDEIVYKIKFGNKGTASATITSVKDFLPKNVKFVSSQIYIIPGNNSYNKVDGVEIDTYGGITLAPGVEGYIIINGTILGENLDSTKQNWACIYLNDQKPDNSVIDEDSGVKDNPSCDYAEHEIDNGLCKKLDIPGGNIGKSGGSKDVSCTASEQVDWIEIDCGNGTKFEGSNISSLDNKTCTYPAGAKTYNLKCTVKKDGVEYTSDSCKGTVTVEGSGGGGDDPYCKAPVQGGDKFTCESTDKVYAIGIDCNHETGKENVDKRVKSDNGREVLSVSEACSASNKVQCYVKKNSNSDWETIPSKCGWEPTTPPGCFPAGTKVIMADGTKKDINEVKEGDKVLSYNPETNANEESIVKQRIVHENNVHEMYELTINGKVLKVTDVHPFYVRKSEESRDYAWVEAQKLKVGDILLMSDGSLAKIEKINHYYNQETVYNLEVEGNHDYFVDEGYLVHNKGGGPSGCFPAGTKVVMADGTKKDINEVKEGDKVLSYNPETNANEESIVKQRIVHENNVHEMYELTINGKVLKVTDVHPFYVRKSEESRDYAWIEAQNLKVGDILLMSDGNLVKIEKINHYYNQETVYNLEVEGNHDYFVDEGYLVHNKGGGGGEDPIYDSVNCFNVNAGNVSIQQGEILPFYWNIEKLSSVAEKGGYVTYDQSKYPFGSDNYNEIIKQGSCTSSDDGNIALNSMMCSFEIRNSNGKIVKTGRYPCLNQPGDISQPLLKAWKNWSIGKYTIGSNGTTKKLRNLYTFNDKNYIFRANVNYIQNFGVGEDVYGEYKIVLTKVEFAQCQDKKWVAGNISPIECQSNFVITNPYTVQKTPSGNLKASTAILSKYKYMNGSAVMSDLLNAIAVSEYEPNNAVSEAMKNFKNKYQKLAVNVGEGTKKVPGKNIYFIEGDKVIKNGQYKKPFTFIQTNPNSTITIEGDSDLNMMVLTEGKIRFKGEDTCNNRQIVKGIFYAGQGLSRDLVQKNTSLSNPQWCTEGGLTVKGVLIGKGLQGMMDNSRSNLNGWFETSDKKGTVMNGASVLIEYSPSVFTKSTMSPGAEDFTTALSIYKN